VEAFERNWDAIIAELTAHATRPGRQLRTMDIYYPFVALDHADGSFDVLSGYLAQIR
jgi:hypothetical protein